MPDLIQEYTDSRGTTLHVDRGASVIRGIKILGLQSRNGRRYLPEALAMAAGLYEGAKVNINHPKGSPLGPRDYQDRLGQIRGVNARADGLFGDLHFNPKHALAEQLLWDAEHAPENVGLSHNVEAKLKRTGQETLVEEILRVQSVDLVADPATTRGLFEEADPSILPPLDHLTMAALKAERPDLCAELLDEQAAELARLQAREAQAERTTLIGNLAAALRLPAPAATDSLAQAIYSATFVEQLHQADETDVRRLLEDRAALITELRRANPARTTRPLARDQRTLDELQLNCRDVNAFVNAIR